MPDDATKIAGAMAKLIDVGITFIEASIDALPLKMTAALRGAIWKGVITRALTKAVECEEAARYEPAEPAGWRPNGSLVWCVDTSDNTACLVPDKLVFKRWASHARSLENWKMVQAPNEVCALAVAREAAKPKNVIETEEIVVDEVSYPTFFDPIPF